MNSADFGAVFGGWMGVFQCDAVCFRRFWRVFERLYALLVGRLGGLLPILKRKSQKQNKKKPIEKKCVSRSNKPPSVFAAFGLALYPDYWIRQIP